MRRVDQLRRCFPAFWAALLAVLLPLSLGQAMAAPQAAVHVCGEANHAPAPHHDCLRCPLCAGVVAQALLPAPAAPAALGCATIAACLPWAPRLANARAPPVCATSPRGPPLLF